MSIETESVLIHNKLGQGDPILGCETILLCSYENLLQVLDIVFCTVVGAPRDQEIPLNIAVTVLIEIILLHPVLILISQLKVSSMSLLVLFGTLILKKLL